MKNKIDSVIKQYLVERDDILADDEIPLGGDYDFSSETMGTFNDMVGGLADTIEDLEIIRLREGDVVTEVDVYSDEYIDETIGHLEIVIERLEFLKGL